MREETIYYPLYNLVMQAYAPIHYLEYHVR
jgi:hypothetical protein